MKTRRGFTLFELMVVIIIIVIVTGMTAMFMTTFFEGNSVRQSSAIVNQAFAHAKQLAADRRRVHFVVFENTADSGVMRVFEDTGNRTYDNSDVELSGQGYRLSEFVWFDLGSTATVTAPLWVAIEPNGYCRYDGGKSDLPASKFEGLLAAGKEAGDIVVTSFMPSSVDPSGTGPKLPYRMCLDVDPAAGKIRKSHFLNLE